MDIKSLQVFISVCATLSFTETAAALHMSISAVSRTVQRLEEELGAQLFDRDRRGIRLSNAARRLQGVAEGMVADWRGLQHALSSGTAIQGDLRVYCSVTATHRLLSPLLAAYREACPRVDVRLQTGDQADGVQRLREGATDVAVIAKPHNLPASLSFLPLTESPMRLCLPTLDCAVSRALQGKRGAALWTALDTAPWILPERGASKQLIERWWSAQRPVEPTVYARVAGHEAIAAMVSLGLGVGIVPELVVTASGVADALRLQAVKGLPVLQIGLCTRSARLSDPVISALWAVAEQSTTEASPAPGS
ncbi:MAG: HTH-type transcriptional activator IlvY [Congregibacter sp.]